MAQKNSDERGMFLGQRRDQLGARILMFLTCIRLSEDYRTDFRFNWFPPGAEAPTLDEPETLFSEEFMAHHFIDTDEMRAIQDRTEPLWKFLEDDTPDALERHLAGGGHVLLDEGFDIVAFPWEDAEALRERFPTIIHRIGFSPFVAERIAQIDAALAQGKNTVAYHIRRGDILSSDPWMHKPWPSKIEPDELYDVHLRKEDPPVALVFSDQPQSIARLRKLHHSVRGIDDIIDLNGGTIAQRDLLELYAMSRTAKIVAPPVSAFSRAAALISGRERLRFIDELDSSERDEAYDTLLERLKNGVDDFVTPSEAAHLYAKLCARLPVQGREQEAYDIGRIIAEAGATNAFVPLLHAVNCVYLHKWDEANRNIKQALDDPNLWQEAHATATAIQALIIGSLGLAKRSHRQFMRAFWQKPNLPDIQVIGSFMINRRRLRPVGPIPFSRGVVNAVHSKYMRSNMLLVQNKLLKRRAFDFSTLVVEWPYFVMDGKSERLLESVPSLEALHDKVLSDPAEDTKEERESYCALVQARMGDASGALARHSALFDANPEEVMLRKRQAEIASLAGAPDMAATIVRPLTDDRRKLPYWHYLYGKFHLACGHQKTALAAWEQAAEMDTTTALIHADLAELQRDMGDVEAAAASLEKAAKIAPAKDMFLNRKERYLSKLKK